MGARKGACGPLWHVHQQIFATFPAEKSPDLSWKLHTKVCKVLHLDNYNILDASPEVNGSMASGLLKNKELQEFFDHQ